MRPQTLFARTGITLAIGFSLFLLFAGVVVVNYILAPVARQAAQDLAALMVLSAQTWVELPPATRPYLESELMEEYDLKVSLAGKKLPPSHNPLPYLLFLRQALEQRLGTRIELGAEKTGTDVWYYADIPMGDRRIRVGFPRSRIGARPPVASILVIAAAFVAIMLISLLLVRRLTRPLERLSEATTRLARGEELQPLPETGPRELVELTRSFNRMARELTELLENRTTLLAGISHDLRTPLTRMRLALEMMQPEGHDATLVDGLRRDMEEIDHMIGHALELARGLERRETEEVDLREFLDGIVAGYRQHDHAIRWQPGDCCLAAVDTLALRRVVTNLIDNAVRYGEGKAVEVRCHCDPRGALIRILDRGPGIPESQREAVFHPFHRLEASRSRNTGGSGLGLAIARQLSRAHGWKIELLGREGGGTEARVRIPTADADPAEPRDEYPAR